MNKRDKILSELKKGNNGNTIVKKYDVSISYVRSISVEGGIPVSFKRNIKDTVYKIIFALFNSPEKTYEEIGRENNISRQRVFSISEKCREYQIPIVKKKKG